jgi:hypothetical protein
MAVTDIPSDVHELMVIEVISASDEPNSSKLAGLIVIAEGMSGVMF